MRHFKHLIFLSILCSLVLFTNCGDSDDVVPFESLADAANNLTMNGFTVYSHVAKGVGHGISPDGLGTALQFMNNMLGFVESD